MAVNKETNFLLFVGGDVLDAPLQTELKHKCKEALKYKDLLVAITNIKFYYYLRGVEDVAPYK